MAYAQICQQEKVGEFVDFPVQGLDLRDYVQDLAVRNSPEPVLYDLYAVSNHYGGLGGGHYTAYGFNSEAKKWFDFNDSSVSVASAADVVSTGAYLLFYRMRDSVKTSDGAEQTNGASA